MLHPRPLVLLLIVVEHFIFHLQGKVEVCALDVEVKRNIRRSDLSLVIQSEEYTSGIRCVHFVRLVPKLNDDEHLRIFIDPVIFKLITGDCVLAFPDFEALDAECPIVINFTTLFMYLDSTKFLIAFLSSVVVIIMYN